MTFCLVGDVRTSRHNGRTRRSRVAAGRDLDGTTGVEDAVAHGVGRRDEGALVHDVNVVAADLDAHVLELDGADGVAVGDNGDAVGEVTSVIVALALDSLGDVLAVGKVHALLDRHVGNALKLHVLDGAGAAVIPVDEVLDLAEHVILSRLYDDEAARLRNVLLVKGLGGSEDAVGQLLAIDASVGCGDDGAAGMVHVAGRRTGSQIEQACKALIHGVGKGFALLVAELVANVEVEHRFLKIVDHQVSNEQAVNVDDRLGDGRVVAAEDGNALVVVMGAGSTGVVERAGNALTDGVDAMQVFEDALAVKGFHNVQLIVGDKEGTRFGGIPIGRDGAVVGTEPGHGSERCSVINDVGYKYLAPFQMV